MAAANRVHNKKETNTHIDMKRIKLIFLPLILLMLNLCTDSAKAPESSKPNFVVILADDFGVGDIQAHYPENKILTPSLDKLVQQGMSFTDAHSASAVCTPTRYGLLTGRYAWRTQLQEWVIACYEPPLIEADRLTLPGYLKQYGYRTACIGKWHLGLNWAGETANRRLEARNALKNENWDFTKPIPGGPTERGFDYYFGTHVPNFPPFTFVENDHVVDQPTAKYIYDPAEGVVMPKSFAGSPMAPGWRFDQILPEITSRAIDYIKQQAKLDAPFFLYFSMTSPHEPVVPTEDFRGKSGIAPIADFVMETDWSAGQIIQAIDDAGIAENTMVIFTADNGHSHYTGWEYLMEAGHLPSGPYRGHKGDIWEGGHRVPFVVRWPGKVKPGTSSNHLVCLNDIFATCSEIVSGDSLPDNVGEDSFSFLGSLTEHKGTSFRKSLVSHSVDGEFAYRKGPWKIVFRIPGKNLDESRGKPARVELYNLDEDIAEQFNMADEHPEVVRQLGRELKSLVQRGTSRMGTSQMNDVHVRFDTIQTERWAPNVFE
jgi:arylsulfatase A